MNITTTQPLASVCAPPIHMHGHYNGGGKQPFQYITKTTLEIKVIKSISCKIRISLPSMHLSKPPQKLIIKYGEVVSNCILEHNVFEQ